MINKAINKLRQIKPEFFFLVIAFIAGSTFLIITPPFQVPDEINHFYKSYQISDGQFKSQISNDRLGGYVPESFVEITKPFLGLRWNRNSKTAYKVITKQFSIPLHKGDKVFVDFPNTALYSPVSYIPQAITIFVLKNLNIAPMYIFYGARFFTLIFWISCIWLTIKITPVYKWLFVLLALLPMSIFINMSLSADVVTNISSFLLIAYIFKIAFSNKSFELKNFVVILFLSVILISAKIVYAPIILLFLIIPFRKFKSNSQFYGYLSLLIVIGLCTALFWSNLINRLYIPYNLYNVNYRDGIDLMKCSNIQEQLDYILNHDFYIFEVFINSMYETFDMYYRGYIGTFGWLDTKLPLWLINISYLIILFVAIFENNKKIILTFFQRIILLCSLMAIIVLVLFSQHLTWDCVGGDIIGTIQGRYFIPAFPLLFMMFNNSRYNKQSLTTFAVISVSILLLFYSSLALYSRYFVYPEYDKITIECNAEKLTEGRLFTTSDSTVFLGNGNRRSHNYSRSGLFSVKLFSKEPYGFTYRLYNGKMHDEITVEVWRFGESGEIVMSGESGKAFFQTSSKVVARDANGWEKLALNYTLQRNMEGKEIGIYLYNPSKDTCYFDDISISIDKIK